MKNLEKYKGVIPAFYACYDKDGKVSPEAVRALTRHLIAKGVKGLYVGGSSGECIYQTVEERKLTLENVVAEAQGKVTIIAHVACNNIAESRELASHAESLKVDAVAAIPPIYFRLPEKGIARFWNDISDAAPNTDFIIYNIPQLAGVSLTVPLLCEMRKNPRVIGVKNSSMPVQDIQMFKDTVGDDGVIFNGPDEQFAGGLAMGADGGIGGTYGVMPELFIKIKACMDAGDVQTARKIQYAVNRIIYKMCSCSANLYAVMKDILRRGGIDIGTARPPLAGLSAQDMPIIDDCERMIREAVDLYTKN